MKQIALFLMIFVIVKIQAQNYQISFAGTGASNTIDSVEVQDVTQCTSISLSSGSDILNLTVTGINELGIRNEELGLKVYPNPTTDYCIIDFEATAEGETNIELYDIAGKRIAQEQEFLIKGQHTYSLSGIGCGIYVLKIESAQYSYSGKIVSCNADFGLGIAELKHISQTNQSTDNQDSTPIFSGFQTLEKVRREMKSLKSNKSGNNLQYHTGDFLKLTGFAGGGKYSTVNMLVPGNTQTVTFTFMACTDGDNNNYTVVKIGTQTWMEENLETTTYNDGGAVPLVPDNKTWDSTYLTSAPAYCWYNDSVKYKSIYGALYNWYAVNTNKLCPTGWHVPDTTEWITLMTYLGSPIYTQGSPIYDYYSAVAGGKMKEACSELWNSPNTGAINSSGFTALPGGGRGSLDGSFYDLGHNGYWWSATEYNAKYAWGCDLSFNNPSAYLYDGYYDYGFSVRCLKDSK